MTIGEQILVLRTEAGLTQQQASSAADVTINTWCDVENGSDPHLSTLRKMLAVFGRDIEIVKAD